MEARRAGTTLVLIMLALMPFSGLSNAQESGTCCEQDGYKMFLMGEAQSGVLTPFSSDLDQGTLP